MNKKFLFSTLLLSMFCSSILLAQLQKSVYVSDAWNFTSGPWKILKFDDDGTNGEVFINTELAWPQDIIFLEQENTVIISNLNSGRITRYDANTGVYIDDFANMNGGPTRMKIGADGFLYIVYWSLTKKIARYNLDGTFHDEFTSAGVNSAIGIDWDQDSNLYVSSYYGDFVQKFDTAGLDSGSFVSTNLVGPTNIWFDKLGSGDLLVNDYDGSAIKRFDSVGNYLGIFANGNGLSNPEGVDFLPNGNILIGSSGNGSVKMYDSVGNYLSDFISTGTLGLKRPNAVRYREYTVSSISNYTIEEQLVYPNFGNEFHLAASKRQENAEFQVLDLFGKKVDQIDADQEIYRADKLSEGMYFIITESGNVKVKQKIIVKH